MGRMLTGCSSRGGGSSSSWVTCAAPVARSGLTWWCPSTPRSSNTAATSASTTWRRWSGTRSPTRPSRWKTGRPSSGSPTSRTPSSRTTSSSSSCNGNRAVTVAPPPRCACSVSSTSDRTRPGSTRSSPCAGRQRASHPAPYPVELVEPLIRMFSFVGDTVLDPFAGTGTTCLAAARCARNSVGIEIEPAYHRMACQRLAQTARAERLPRRSGRRTCQPGAEWNGTFKLLETFRTTFAGTRLQAPQLDAREQDRAPALRRPPRA